MQAEPIQHDALGKQAMVRQRHGHRTPSPTLARLTGLGVQIFLPCGAGKSWGSGDPRFTDQRPSAIDNLQLDQLALAGCGNQHGAHLNHVGDRGAPCAQPVAQRVRQRLRAAFNLQIAAQDATPIGRKPTIGRGPQRAHGGDDGHSQGKAEQHDPGLPPGLTRGTAHSAPEFAPCQAKCQHHATGST